MTLPFSSHLRRRARLRAARRLRRDRLYERVGRLAAEEPADAAALLERLGLLAARDGGLLLGQPVQPLAHGLFPGEVAGQPHVGAMVPRFRTRRMLRDFAPDIVHIATEGPIGWAARGWCRANEVPFTSAFHTRFPDYAAMRTGLSPDRFWPIMRRFHSASHAVLVSTPTLAAELAGHGLTQATPWSRGIDASLFHPAHAPLEALADLPRPIMLNVGRVAVEKNLGAFLEADVPGTKVIVGNGPDLAQLRARYPHVHFLGALSGAPLAQAYCSADVFVFPSRTDTFGLVMIEAMACGTPVIGVRRGSVGEVVSDGLTGYSASSPEGLADLVGAALKLDRQTVRNEAEKKFGYRTMVDSYVELYRRLCAAH